MLDGCTNPGWKMSHFVWKNLFWVVKNVTGYHPGPATPSTTDGALWDAHNLSKCRMPRTHDLLVRAVAFREKEPKFDLNTFPLKFLSLGGCHQASQQKLPRGNGVMDSTLACSAGGPGSIPAVGKSKFAIFRWFFSPSRQKVVGLKWSQTRENCVI